MKISFCTTCCNRLHQFRETLEENAAILDNDPLLEWVVLNFRSSDGLHEYMLERLPELSERIVYAVDSSAGFWHAPTAKNIAMRLGRGDILMSLDCDNFIRETPRIIRESFAGDRNRVLQMWSGVFGDGTYGRIALGRDLFEALGGFDEEFSAMGYHDLDLIERGRALGALAVKHTVGGGYAIRNSKEEGMKYSAPGSGSWLENVRKNEVRSLKNLQEKRLIANTGWNWGRARVEIFRGGGRLLEAC